MAGTFPARLARVLVLIGADLLALAGAGAIAYVAWARSVRNQPAEMYLELLPLVALFVVGYARAGLYPGFGLGPVETLRRLSYVTAFGFLIVAAFSFALKLPHLYSRVTFAVAFALSLLFVPLGRLVVFYLARDRAWWSEPVVVIGTGDRARRVIRNLSARRHLGYRPLGVLALSTERATEVADLPVLGTLDDAPAAAARGIRVALFEGDRLADRHTLDQLYRHFHHVVLVGEYGDLPIEGLQIRNLGDLVGIEYTNNLLLHRNRVVKRVTDVVGAAVALLVAGPVILICGLLVKAIDRGPAFFLQHRAGLDGRRIAVPKIRTMRLGADRELHDRLAENADLRAEWEERQKLRDDPRLVPIVGRLFRRFSLDELPQLWSVLKGDMSLVGPRPFPDYHLEKFSPTFRDLRQRVRPGITGLWQVTVRSDGGVDAQEGFDSYYIRNWSIWLDLYILGRTVAAVASGRGAY